MADTCSDCGLARDIHVRGDGVYNCPEHISLTLCESCHEPMISHINPVDASIICPGRYVSTMQDTSQYAESSVRRPRSESPDPLLLVPDKQPSPSQRHNPPLRRSAPIRSAGNAVVPLRRSSRLENLRRSRAEPYSQARARRPSRIMAEVPMRKSRSRRVSTRDNKLISDRSYENDSVYPAQEQEQQEQHTPPFHRKSLQPYVLDRMVPPEDMDPIEGFKPFTEIDPGQDPDPVTIREPMRDLAPPMPPFEFVFNPSVTIPEVGGMRVRVGQFERIGHPAGDTAPFASTSAADQNETDSLMSGTEDFVSVPDWSSPYQAEFTQGSTLPLQRHALPSDSRDIYSSYVGNELVPFETLSHHFFDAHNQESRLPPLQIQPLPGHAVGSEPSYSTLVPHPFHQPNSLETPCPPRANASFQYPFTQMPMPTPTPTAPQPFEIEQSHAAAQPRPQPRRRSSMPGTLIPDATITDIDTDTEESSHPHPSRSKSEMSTPDLSMPDRGETEPAVDKDEDWAGRNPWEYIHHVLTTSTRHLVMFFKTSTADVLSAVKGAQSVHLNLHVMVIDNELWLLVGPSDVNLREFGDKFQMRAKSDKKFVFQVGNLNWGAKVDEIENEVVKAGWKTSGPATLPAQFMAGAIGGLVVWYALSLM